MTRRCGARAAVTVPHSGPHSGDRPSHLSIYPFCPNAALRRLPGEIAAAAGTRGWHGVALYPSSCAVCGYKRGYNAAVMLKARWKCAALKWVCGSDI